MTRQIADKKIEKKLDKMLDKKINKGAINRDVINGRMILG